MFAGQNADAPAGPRPTWIRHLAGVLAILLYLAPPVFLPPFQLPLWSSQGETVMSIGQGVYLILSGLIFLPFLSKVSYRHVDILFLIFVPIWCFVVAWRVGWRLAFLPYRDWEARPDEAGRIEQIDDRGTYVLKPSH